MIVKIEVPISDYYGEEVFFKELFFEVDSKSPSKEETIRAVSKIHEENLQYPEYCNEEGEALEILKIVDDWRVVGDSLVLTNTFIQHPKFGRQPVTWSIVRPINIQ